MYRKCVLRTITDFIKIMSPKIKYVRVIVNKGNIETLLDVNQWIDLVKMCTRLEKITLKVIRNMSPDKKFVQKIQEIDDSLHDIRQSIKFQVEVK